MAKPTKVELHQQVRDKIEQCIEMAFHHFSPLIKTGQIAPEHTFELDTCYDKLTKIAMDWIENNSKEEFPDCAHHD